MIKSDIFGITTHTHLSYFKVYAVVKSILVVVSLLSLYRCMTFNFMQFNLSTGFNI